MNQAPYVLSQRHWLPVPLGEVFSFFERPENLEYLTPASLRFKIHTPSPVPMHAGALIDYTIRLSGIPIRWQTQITEYEPPHSFIDEQRHGPYLLWRHRHRFWEEQGGTVVEDRVEYALRFGWIGRLVHALYVRHKLESIFDYRAEAIRKYVRRHQPS